MKQTRSALTVAAVATCVLGSAQSAAGGSLVSLKGSLKPLQERFNAAADKPRVVAILSPT